MEHKNLTLEEIKQLIVPTLKQNDVAHAAILAHSPVESKKKIVMLIFLLNLTPITKVFWIWLGSN